MLRSNLSTLSLFARRNVFQGERLLGRLVSRTTVEHDDKTAAEIADTKTETSTGNYLGIDENDTVNAVHGHYQYAPEQKSGVRQQLQEKFETLMPSMKQKEKREINTWFGKVRLDSDNVPKYHGQFENDVDDEFVEVRFEDIATKIKEVKIEVPEHEDTFVSNKPRKAEFVIDEDIEAGKSNTPQSSLTANKINFRFASQFKHSVGQVNKEVRKKYQQRLKDLRPDEDTDHKPPFKSVEEQVQSVSDKMAQIKLEHFERKEQLPQPIVLSGEDYLKRVQEGKLPATRQNNYEELNSKAKLDSKGYRVLSNQTIDFNALSNRQIVEILEQNVIFNDCDIVALNKPYGISIYGTSQNSKDSLHSLNEEFENIDEVNNNTSPPAKVKSGDPHLHLFLPELAERLGCSKLYTVHRLDRDTTGVLLLAKTQEKARQLNHLFRGKEIQKRYLCITRGVPDNLSGSIDIPIELGIIRMAKGPKRERMVLCPEPMENIRAQRRPSRKAKQAVTRYRVLSDRGNAALLEVFPETGVRHQIRVHLGFGLRTPILGDHKYSHLDKLAPQRLPSDMLMALRVRQAKARHIPMHLHAYVLMIPRAGEFNRDIFIRAPIPLFFRKNLASLKLRLP